MKKYYPIKYELILLTFFLSVSGVSGAVYNINENNTISVTTGYINNMEDVWNVTGSITNRPLAVYYSISIEDNYDNILIYEVDANNNATHKITLTGNKTGVIYMSNPTGKVKVVFDTDGSLSYTPPQYVGIYLSFSYPDNLLISNNAVFNSIRGTQTGGALRINTEFGNLDLGAQNTSWAHIYTDKPKIIFNKPLYSITGEFSSYNTSDLSFQTNGTTRMSVLNSNGNVGIGISPPLAKLHVNSGPNNNYAAILATSNEGNNLVISSFDTQPANCKVFQISHEYSNSPGNRNNGYIAFYRGSSVSGGYLDLGTNGMSRLFISSAGNIGMGTSVIPSTYKLAVAGKIIAEELTIKLQSSGWPDYVFKPDYHLKPISEVESFVKKNHHLPGIPNAATVENEGVGMGELQRRLLLKIEELTLYIIQQNNRISELEKKISE